ncbi:T9SS type A sorting domain-containing protein [Psychroserpens mesophilus]|uniref:T9SS type A sorting domain-containing protein n=1 Tax=Psychroserpens mesophilus TaxID=325473 RepID=UPI00058B8E70|nr:T9SS type A sorting domain-containing protein [Psychroserpens mesophilus]
MKTNTISIILVLLSLVGYSQVQIGNDIDGDAIYDSMGWDVAMSGDGQTVVVGAPGNSDGAYAAGQVKVFQFNGTDWIQLGNDILGTADEDGLGRSVDITSDGLTVVVGTQYSDVGSFNSGSARVFEFNGTNWVQKGNTVAGVNVNDEFSTSISISNDGNRIAVGAPYTDTTEFDNGVLRIFDYDGSQWNLVFEHFGDNENDVFGMSLDMSGDGNHVICGAWINIDGTTREGYAKIFSFENSTWSQTGQTISGEVPGNFFGASSSISDDGSIVAIGSWGNDENGTDSGEVKVFQLIGNTWQTFGNEIQGSDSFERFGWAIDLSSSGTVLAVGAPQENNTRFFKFDNGNWIMVGNAIAGEAINDDFGFSVDLSSDGTKVVIGDPYRDVNGNNSGFVQVYDITNVLSVEEFESEIFSVFPNPTKSTLTIQSKVATSYIKIVDINGRLLNTIDNLNLSQEVTLEVDYLSNGIYFLNIQSDNSEQVIRFIKN